LPAYARQAPQPVPENIYKAVFAPYSAFYESFNNGQMPGNNQVQAFLDLFAGDKIVANDIRYVPGHSTYTMNREDYVMMLQALFDRKNVKRWTDPVFTFPPAAEILYAADPVNSRYGYLYFQRSFHYKEDGKPRERDTCIRLKIENGPDGYVVTGTSLYPMPPLPAIAATDTTAAVAPQEPAKAPATAQEEARFSPPAMARRVFDSAYAHTYERSSAMAYTWRPGSQSDACLGLMLNLDAGWTLNLANTAYNNGSFTGSSNLQYKGNIYTNGLVANAALTFHFIKVLAVGAGGMLIRNRQHPDYLYQTTSGFLHEAQLGYNGLRVTAAQQNHWGLYGQLAFSNYKRQHAFQLAPTVMYALPLANNNVTIAVAAENRSNESRLSFATKPYFLYGGFASYELWLSREVFGLSFKGFYFIGQPAYDKPEQTLRLGRHAFPVTIPRKPVQVTGATLGLKFYLLRSRALKEAE
jgi:hypothetical protein